MRKAFCFLLFSALPAWADGPSSQVWLSGGVGAKGSAFHQIIASTTTDVEFKYLEAPSASFSAEKLAQVFSRKVILGLQGTLSYATFTSDAGLALPDGNMLLHDFSFEAKTSLYQGQALVLLLGAQHSAQPWLARPATATGVFSYEKVSTLAGVAGLGTSFLVFGKILRSYFRFGYPFSCGSDCSLDGGFTASLLLDYAILVSGRSSWFLQAYGAHSSLEFTRFDALTRTSLLHELSGFSAGLRGVYSYRF